MDQPPYTSEDFQKDVHRQLVNTALAALSDTPLTFAQAAPFLDAARAVCRDDLRLNGRLAINGLEFAGAQLVPSHEAYLSVSIRDRTNDVEWLSQTYWLSDLALADLDPERVRSVVAAIERSLAKLRDWLAAQEAEAEAQAEAPEPPAGDESLPQ